MRRKDIIWILMILVWGAYFGRKLWNDFYPVKREVPQMKIEVPEITCSYLDEEKTPACSSATLPAESDIHALLNSGRIVPYSPKGQPLKGFALCGLKPNSTWLKACLRNGDVVIKVDDEVIDDPEEGFLVPQIFMDAGSHTLTVRRDDKESSIKLTIKK